MSRTFFGALLLCCSWWSSASSEEVPARSLDRFSYRPERIVVGTVYRFVKSNQDGTRSSDLFLYVEAKNRITAFKPDKGSPDAAYITAIMDWSMFCPSRLEARRVDATGRKRFLGQVEFERNQEAGTVRIKGFGQSSSVPVENLPIHSWDFDFASLNFSLRHLVDPESRFSFGIADVDRKAPSPRFAYNGQVTVEFVGEEKRQGVSCRKYSVDGPGLENRGGFLWVSREEQHLVEAEIGLPDEPGYKDIRIRLAEVSRMSPEEWEAHVRKQFGR